MSKGFFATSKFQTGPPKSMFPQCGKCKLHERCKHPKLTPSGAGRRKILFVGNAPSSKEDKYGSLLLGDTSSHIRQLVETFGLDLEDDCWYMNAIACKTHHDLAPPSTQQIEYCSPLFAKHVKELQPTVIIPMGLNAVNAVLRPYGTWRIDKMQDWAGQQIPFQPLNSWIMPTFHPAEIADQRSKEVAALMSRMLKQHVRTATKTANVPWPKGIPAWEGDVKIELVAKRAARILDGLVDRSDIVVSFDIETNMLKPEPLNSRIVTCAVTWGKDRDSFECLAFPWHGAAQSAMSRLLASSTRIVGANIKFEDRWVSRHLGHEVKNWVHDVLLFARLENNQSRCGLKYLALTRFGMASFNTKTEKLLEAEYSQFPNQIDEIDLHDLLRYNGMDTIVTYFLYWEQIARWN